MIHMTDAQQVLIIEDDTSLREVLSEKFKKEQFNVIEAKNGQEGLDAALEKHPDIILLDIIMPVMDGITMLSRLRKDSWGKDASVIIITNLSDGKEVEEALAKGVHDFLVKSNWKIAELVEIVRKKISSK